MQNSCQSYVHMVISNLPIVTYMTGLHRFYDVFWQAMVTFKSARVIQKTFSAACDQGTLLRAWRTLDADDSMFMQKNELFRTVT